MFDHRLCVLTMHENYTSVTSAEMMAIWPMIWLRVEGFDGFARGEGRCRDDGLDPAGRRCEFLQDEGMAGKLGVVGGGVADNMLYLHHKT